MSKIGFTCVSKDFLFAENFSFNAKSLYCMISVRGSITRAELRSQLGFTSHSLNSALAELREAFNIQDSQRSYMLINRKQPASNFTKIPNFIIHNKALTPKQKGPLYVLLSRNKGMDTSSSRAIARVSKESSMTISRILNELKEIKAINHSQVTLRIATYTLSRTFFLAEYP